VTFDASASTPNGGTITSYVWNFGDGTPEVVETDPITTHNYTSEGTFNVTLTVFDDEGYSDTAWKLVTVSAPSNPEASFTYHPAYPVVNYTVTFNATDSIPNDTLIVNYTWDFGDGNITTTTNPIITHNYTSSGTFNVTLTVYNDAGFNDTTWQTITILSSIPTPKITVEPSTYIITHEGQTFNVSIVVSDLTVYLRVIGGQFRLPYNNTYLQVLNITEGPFFPSFPQRPDPPYTIFTAFDEVDPLYGPNVAAMDMLLPNDTGVWTGPFPEGEGVMATITFNVSSGFMETLPLNFYIADNQTCLSDDTPAYVSVQVTNGTVYPYYTVNITDQPDASYNRGEVASMKFTIQYWDGSYYTAENFSSIRVKIFDGTTFVDEVWLSPTDFNPLTNEWTAKILIPWEAPLLDTYQFVISAYDITDNNGVSGPMVDVESSPFSVTALIEPTYETLDVEIDVGSIHFAGETAEFYTLVTLKGNPINVTTITATLYYEEGQQKMDLTPNIELIATGLYRVPFTLPIDAEAGTYTLMVEARYTTFEIEAHGADIRSFQVSDTLNGWGALLDEINGTIVTIVIPNLAEIKANLTEIKAAVVDINSTVATINTTLGYVYAYVDAINATVIRIEGTVAIINTTLNTLQTSVDAINATVSELIVNSKGEILAKIDTALGEVTTSLDDIEAKITSIEGDVATIETTVGTIKTSLDDLTPKVDDAKGAAEGAQSAATTTLYATSILSAIAAIVAILILLLILRKK